VKGLRGGDSWGKPSRLGQPWSKAFSDNLVYACLLPPKASFWMFCPLQGLVRGVGGWWRARSYHRRCMALGSVWMSERQPQFFASAVSVEVLGCRP
jgi:hypothetical protein